MSNLVERFFGRGGNVIEAIGSVSEQQLNMMEFMQELRATLEMMEARLTSNMDNKFKSLNTRLVEIEQLMSTNSPEKVVKAIERNTQEDKKLRQYNLVRTQLEKAMAKYLVNDLPLFKEVERYKNVELTPQGEAMYQAVSRFIINLAKVSGEKKEKYTNFGKYREFFRMYEITPYKRMTVRLVDGTNMNTLLAAVIVNGHIRQYIDYIFGLLEREKEQRK